LCHLPAPKLYGVDRLIEVAAVPSSMPRFSLTTVYLEPALAFSFITATLGTNGWLDLVRQGLSPCKKRQASLGALTVCVTRAGAGGRTPSNVKNEKA